MTLSIDEAIKGKRIIVVDDNKDMVYLYRKILKDQGYQVGSAENGLDGIQLILKELPDLVLLDLSMPKMDGYQVCKRLKNIEETKTIPVIMVTCRGNTRDKIYGLELGADDYIKKPVNNEVLLARVKSLLKMKEMHERLTEARKLETLAQVAVSVNHEINNPLCSISANAEMLKTSIAGADERLIHKVDIILKEVDRIKQVVSKLTNATRVISTEYISGVKMLDLDESTHDKKHGG
ncbi:response regulator [bacterium]|nr:response regulator [bacterium]